MDNNLVPPPAVMRVWIVVLVVTSFLNAGYAARNAEVSRIEFLNEPPPVRVKIPDTPGCVFGDRFYELEQTWHPELLQSGVLYCVLCQCLPNIDKGVLNSKGHVTCRDIKSECPEVTCDNPVLLPEQCCKTCPGQALPVFRAFSAQGQQPPWAENASIATYEDMANVNTKRIRQDFIAVLTGFSATRPVATSGVGVAYFSLYQSTLVYSLHLEGIRKPRSLQIIDTHGTVFHSLKLDGRKRQQIVCGSVSWPDVYTGFLKRRRLFIQIDTRSNRDGEIRGEIQPKESLSSDTFASLLTPSEKNGRGGVVLVRLGDNPNTLVFTALIAGIQPADQENRRPTLTFKVGNKKKTFHKNVIHPDTTMYNITMVTWPWNNVKKRIEKFLVAEKLTVHVTLPNDGELVGKLTVRNTCNGFWSIMKSTRRSVHTIGASGMVLIQYQKKGVIRYKATMSGIPDKVSKIIMTTMSRAKKPFCEISGNSMRFNKHSLQYTGKGKCKRLPISAVSSLLRHQVAISVFTAADEKAVVAEGSISEILYNGNIEEVSDDPVLLVNNEINPSIIPLPVGLAWLTLSELCQLHYQVMVRGYEDVNEARLQLLLSEEDGRLTRSITLGHVTDNMVMGSEAELPDYLYSALHQGDARLVVFSTYKNVSQLSGQLRIKNRCNRQQARDKAIETKKLPVLDPDTVQDDPGVVSPIERQCMTDGNVYQDMDTWPDKPGSCKICSCKRKVVECHDVLCPNLTDCRTPVHIEGECCPQCKDLVDTSASCYYPGDKRKHFRGAIWHPYVPPFGFMPCAVCQCSERSGEVNCTRVMCPELTCPEEKAFLKSKTDCCKVCPEMIQGDIDEEGACMFRGHKHYNGTSWHPNVQPFGVMKCITCSCINGQATCIREKCPQLKCDRRRRIIMPNDCCPICRKHVPRRGYAKYRRKKQ